MKPKNTIKTDAEFLRVVDEVALSMPALAMKKAELEAELQKVRAAYAVIDEMQAAYDDRMAALEAYMNKSGVAARLFLEGKKYGKTAHATYGHRAGKPALAITQGHEEQAIIAAIEASGRVEWLTTPAPKLNKAAIMGAGLAESELAALGLEVTAKTTFYVKAKDSK